MTARRAAGGTGLADGPDGHHGGPSASAASPGRAEALLLVRGAVAVSLGVLLLVAGTRLSRLTTFVAIYWIVAAVLTLRWVGERRALPHRRLAFGAGVLGGLVRDDQSSQEVPRRRYRFVIGPLEVLLGLALVFVDTGSAPATRLWGLATGTVLLLDGLMVGRLARAAGGGPT